MSSLLPRIGGRYKHYLNGKIYRVLNIARPVASLGRRIVIFVDVDDKEKECLAKDMYEWHEHVFRDGKGWIPLLTPVSRSKKNMNKQHTE